MDVKTGGKRGVSLVKPISQGSESRASMKRRRKRVANPESMRYGHNIKSKTWVNVIGVIGT